MFGLSKQSGLAGKSGRQKQVILLVIAVTVALELLLTSPDLAAISLCHFAKVLQSLEAIARLDAFTLLRSQEEILQNLSARLLAKGEWIPLEIRPRAPPFALRMKYVFMVASVDISVIVPTWNEEKYLERCLGSLLNQSVKQPVEIIVVDGGSKDRTLRIAEKYAQKILVEPSKPVGAARNLGAKEAEGETLAFIDADTIASPRWLEAITRTFKCNRDGVGVTGPTLPYEGTRLDELVYRVSTGWVQRLALKLGIPHLVGFNCAYRKTAFWDAGGFDENRELSEDIMLSLRIRHHGQILFNPGMVAYTSLRRIKKYGYPYLMTYYGINEAMMLLFDRTLGYPKVR